MGGETPAGEPWRARYEEALERLEAAERRWADQREALVRLATRLALAGHGIDPALDRELERAREALKGELDPEDLTRRAEALGALLRRLAEVSAGQDAETPPAPAVPEAPREAAPADGESTRPPARAGGRRGFLARLLGGRSGRQDAPAAGDGAPRALGDLLDALPADADLAGRVERLRSRLAAADGPRAWADILEEAARLVQEARRRLERERAEFERFLAQVGERLQEIDGYMQAQDEAREAALQDGRALDEAVRGQVAGIEDSLREAHDLEALKAAVQARIERVREHLAGFRASEEARYRAAREEAERLRGRLEALEREAEALRERVREERRLALRDPLTGLPNRLAYEERIAQEHARWRRFGTPLSLVVVDVDRFKRINDSYGHKAGDKVLRAIGRLLARRVRETDLAARYGGEEFVVVLPGAEREAALRVAEELRAAVAGYGFHHAGEPVEVTVSCGVATFEGEDTPEQVFERADAALYRAKAAGRNRCEAG